MKGLAAPDRLENCVCLCVRRTARAVTRSYDRGLSEAGLNSSQFAVLAALAAGAQTMSSLADHLVMDRTTLTRNLGPLIRSGLVGVRRGRDARTRVVEITVNGTRKLKNALPLWRSAQRMTVAAVGSARYSRLMATLSQITDRSVRQ
ncbi:MAG TPA: MarR family winged helix-turn-helix transcriptional regulator [Candidatus Binatus sp.]|nr:MarR family winged helix-turn-helix transcriptional regulator [Candidatus Binatus sp.]